MIRENKVCESSSRNIDSIKRKILIRIPSDISDAMRNYERITADPNFYDIKAFSAQQAASRAVLGHIQLLIRLAEWAQGSVVPSDDGLNEGDVDRLIRDAKTYIEMEDSILE